MKHFVVVTVSLIFSTTCALALDQPNYDTELYCRTTGSNYADNSTKELVIKTCLEEEKRQAVRIKRVISYVDEATIRTCNSLASGLVGGSYKVFAGCLVLTVTELILDGKLEVSFPKK